MKRNWIDYTKERAESPMTYWVHQGPAGEHWRDATDVIPPLPRPVPGLGYALRHVEYKGFTFVFASLDELDVCVSTLSERNLPTSRRLSADRASGVGPNSHWLSRLPGKIKSWSYREGAVKYLAQARLEFERKMMASY